MSGDEDDNEFVLEGRTAGAKRTSDDGAAATAKLAMGAMAKARVKDRADAPIVQGDLTDEGGNPEAPPKSGFPSVTLYEDVWSWDDDEDELVVKEPAAREKGGG